MVLDLQLDPVLVRWGAVAVTWNSVCTTLALLVGTWLALGSMEHRGVTKSAAGSVACWTLAGGFVGSRAGHVLAHALYYAVMPHEIVAFNDASGSIAGALLGGGLAALVTAPVFNVSLRVFINSAIPSLLIGAVLHATGNLLTGAGWGAPTAGWGGVIYWHPNALVPPDLISVPLHPLPLYQIIVSLALLALWALLRQRAVGAWRLGQEVR